MKRIFDIILSLVSLFLLFIPMVFIAIAIKLTSRGPIMHWSSRIGKNNKLFLMPKFRTMYVGAPDLPTHLLEKPDKYVTGIGSFLRKTSLDELPQLLSIVKGDMSIVGPRPALFNQDDLIELRTRKGVHKLTPGLTGWAQINGRDELPIPVKVDFDFYYLVNQSFLLDLKIIIQTALKVVLHEGVTH
jgi:O-antigen biosynthesis protein WbqP